MLIQTAALATLSFSQVLLLLGIVVVGMLAAGILVSVTRAKVPSGDQGDPPGSVVRSWIAISLVMGLLIFCAAAFLIDDPSLRSTLFGGLIASVGAAVAFYFSSKAADQARTDVLNATMALAQFGTPPTGFVAMSPTVGSTGAQYRYQFVANGQPTPRYTLASGSLPPGLVLAADGTLEGTPTAQGSSTFSVRATNSAGSFTSPDIQMNVG